MFSLTEAQGFIIFLDIPVITYILNYLWPVNIVSTKQLFPRFDKSATPVVFVSKVREIPHCPPLVSEVWASLFSCFNLPYSAYRNCNLVYFPVLKKGSMGLWDRDAVRLCLYFFVGVTLLHNQPIHGSHTRRRVAQQRSAITVVALYLSHE
jgi:hypothetical protein